MKAVVKYSPRVGATVWLVHEGFFIARLYIPQDKTPEELANLINSLIT